MPTINNLNMIFVRDKSGKFVPVPAIVGPPGKSPEISVQELGEEDGNGYAIIIKNADETVEKVYVRNGEDGSSPEISMEYFSDAEGSGVEITIINADGSTETKRVYDGKNTSGGGVVSGDYVPLHNHEPNKVMATDENGDFVLEDMPDADPKGTADSKVAAHNNSEVSHNDIRLLISGLSERLNAAETKIPTKTSDLTNDSGFVTKSVSDLANYYAKSKTYTRDEINELISAIPKFSISVVSSLPSVGISETTVYLVKSGSGDDLFTEYIFVDGDWEILGSQRVDLTGYAKETWVNTKLSDYLKGSDLQGAINTALAQAKASGEFDGASPEITLTEVNLPDSGVEIAVKNADGSVSYAYVYNGKDGKTPVKGEDYFTESDKQEIAQKAADMVDIPDAPVQSVNGKTGAVDLTAEDVGAATGEQFEQLSKTIADYETLGLGVHTDGKLYIYKNGMPYGNGVVIDFAGDVVGTLDDNNDIVLNGNLADGTYTLKYAMADGTYVEIGNLVINNDTDTTVYYSVTNNLTYCSNSNSATQVAEGSAYSATITANSGHELKTVTVTMGGNPVTVSGGSIDIANVTGDIVITAVAEEAVEEIVNLIKTATNADGTPFVGTNGEVGYKADTRLSVNDGGERTGATGVECTGFIEAGYNDTLYFKNIVITSSNTDATICFYNESHTKVGTGSITSNFIGTTNGEVISKKLSTIATVLEQKDVIKYVRICADEITADSIITKNQPIE